MSVTINPIDVKAIDERGTLHYFSTDRTGEFLLVYRNAGSISGRHFHKGISAGKNPEDMLLVQGTASLHWKDLKTNMEETVTLVAPIRVNIQAHIWHELTAITDLIFVELNSLVDGSEDTFRL
jgi:hypothetical protein